MFDLFQSTPVITDGRTHAYRDHAAVQCRFNPRPSSLTGEPPLTRPVKSGTGVSIHARHH